MRDFSLSSQLHLLASSAERYLGKYRKSIRNNNKALLVYQYTYRQEYHKPKMRRRYAKVEITHAVVARKNETLRFE